MNYQKILTLIAMIGMFTNMSANSIEVDDISICPGETREFYIYMQTSRTNLVAFQIDLKLPEGLTVNVDNCKLTSRILETNPAQKLFAGCLDETNRIYRLTSTSYDLKKCFSTERAPLVKVSITASEDFKGGKISLQDMFTVDSEVLKVDWISADLNVKSVPNVKYDFDRNELVTVNDVMLLVNYVLRGEYLYTNKYDVNGDGIVDVNDVEFTVHHVLGLE